MPFYKTYEKQINHELTVNNEQWHWIRPRWLLTVAAYWDCHSNEKSLPDVILVFLRNLATDCNLNKKLKNRKTPR